MKITKKIINAAPVLDKVVLELEPREAFLLATMLGNRSPEEMRKITNLYGFAEAGGDNFTIWGGNVKGLCSLEEARLFESIYKEIRESFISFEKNSK